VTGNTPPDELVLRRSRQVAEDALGAEYTGTLFDLKPNTLDPKTVAAHKRLRDGYGSAATAGTTGRSGSPAGIGDGLPPGWGDSEPVPDWWTPELPFAGKPPAVVLMNLPDGAERRLLLSLLASWVEAQAGVFYMGPKVLPVCWLEHPRLVVTLYAAWRSYLASANPKAEPRQHITALQDWWSVSAQLMAEAETEAGGCVSAREHRPPEQAKHRGGRVQRTVELTGRNIIAPKWPSLVDGGGIEGS
jgi:hypothetical protein